MLDGTAFWFMGCSWGETLQVAEPRTAGEQHASKHATMSQTQLVQRRGVSLVEASYCHCHTEKFRHKTIHSNQKISIGNLTLPFKFFDVDPVCRAAAPLGHRK